MQFTKMHTLGNSYVLVNLLEESLDVVNFSAFSKYVSNVNVGIGSDGMILVGPSEQADFQIKVFNKDGREVKKAWSGLRCAAKYLYETMYAHSTDITFETLGGVIRIVVEVEEKWVVKNVLVNIGEQSQLELDLSLPHGSFTPPLHEIKIGEVIFRQTHLVEASQVVLLLVNSEKNVNFAQIGSLLENANLLQEKEQLGMVKVLDQMEIQYRLWDKEDGFIKANENDVCEAVATCAYHNLLDQKNPISVHLDSGHLTVIWDDNNDIWTKGEVHSICYGELEKLIVNKSQ